MQILAATDFSTRSNRALRQAGLLAQASNADLALVHVVDDDQPEALVDMEKREAERILAEQVSVMAELQGVKCRPTVIRLEKDRNTTSDKGKRDDREKEHFIRHVLVTRLRGCLLRFIACRSEAEVSIIVG